MGRFMARLLAATIVVFGILAGQAGLASASPAARAAPATPASPAVAAKSSVAAKAAPVKSAGKPEAPAVAAGPQDDSVGNAILPGFDSQTYGPNDDGSFPCTGPDPGTPDDCTPTEIPLPFPVTFYGEEYSSVYLNNNGNLTFGDPLSQFTPESLNQIDVPMIAPFWSDVDTRSGPTVTFGYGTVDDHEAFGVNWLNVGCFDENDDVDDSFQVVLIDRPDLGTDDWQIEFNYGPLTWDSGQASGGDDDCLNGTPARAGYTDGDGTACQLPGSGVSGSLLDVNSDTGLEYNSFDSDDVLGRYVYSVSGDDGVPDGCDSYFALGDSYSSGEGAGDYTASGGNCDRSADGWPRLLDRYYQAVPPISGETFLACQGDTIPDIENGSPNEPESQLTALADWVQDNGRAQPRDGDGRRERPRVRRRPRDMRRDWPGGQDPHCGVVLARQLRVRERGERPAGEGGEPGIPRRA